MSATQRAFSLTEVLLAMAVFGLAALVMLGLLPALARSSGEAAEALVAQGLGGSLRQALHRRIAAIGLPALAQQVPLWDNAQTGGLGFVAPRSGREVLAREMEPPTETEPLAGPAQFYLLESWRFPTPPLAYETGDDVIILLVRVSWPYQVPGAEGPVLFAQRRSLLFVLSLRP